MTRLERRYSKTEKAAIFVAIVGAILVCFTGVAGAANEAGLLEGTAMGDALASGSAQAVLSVALLGVSGACIYLTKQLIKIQADRVEETQLIFKDTVSKNTEALAANTEAMKAVKEGYEICKDHQKGRDG